MLFPPPLLSHSSLSVQTSMVSSWQATFSDLQRGFSFTRKISPQQISYVCFIMHDPETVSNARIYKIMTVSASARM